MPRTDEGSVHGFLASWHINVTAYLSHIDTREVHLLQLLLPFDFPSNVLVVYLSAGSQSDRILWHLISKVLERSARNIHVESIEVAMVHIDIGHVLVLIWIVVSVMVRILAIMLQLLIYVTHINFYL